MPGDLFSDGGHRYTSSCASERGPVTCWLSCCARCCCLCCVAWMYALSTCWWRARRRPWCHSTCAIKVRMVWRLSGSCCRWSLPAKSSQLSACCHWSRAQSRSCTARLSQKTTWCQRARSRSWMAQVECWSACVSQYRPPKAVLVAISAEGVSTSWPKAAQACLTSCSGTHRVERVDRSGKEEREAHAEVSCCSCADRGSTVVIGSPFFL